ncbi:MAG: tRNA (adenosine(37)-N6)-threonylcarbamoyltransferase complex dimerization subunit type 1 TsaB [Chitinivibrionales bacterium]|nr:tRNA (adenosine(37)-N6)-threonylcarbamoyltransferase complex dimerization subunit type 1 TsaB [Chitinivibrionales bacterium]MBD3396811.1 tRNA (adenosine(37)-N6)-threonylcarbamoyltransferase complex dimerization subunit type 1 TsaB [Chitinivibrionales bacterium]
MRRRMTCVLGIDTASTQLDLGLIQDGEPVCSYCRYAPNSHAEHITDAVRLFIQAHGLAPADITCAGVTVGPGSFTGLRIGIAFMKGFFLGRDARILPLSSIEVIAQGWHGLAPAVAIALDARRDHVYGARFTKIGGACERVMDDVRLPVARFAEMLGGEDVVLVDNLGYRASSLARAFGETSRVRDVNAFPVQRGLAAARLAWQRLSDTARWVTPADLVPHYLQESSAELKKRAGANQC